MSCIGEMSFDDVSLASSIRMAIFMNFSVGTVDSKNNTFRARFDLYDLLE